MDDSSHSDPRPDRRTRVETPAPGPAQPAIRVIMMPKDTNSYGTIFGGIILSYIDQAGAVEAYRRVSGRFVTVAMREVEFHHPVFVGDLVSFYTDTVRTGTTSISVRVSVEAERSKGVGRVKVTEAEVVYVHVDDDGQPRPLPAPPETSGASETEENDQGGRAATTGAE